MIFIGKVLYYLFFYMILGIIVLSFFHKREGSSKWLDKESTKELKGIAVLMVLIGHMTYMYGMIQIPLTPALGAPAVDIFLFLSGFGLMLSYENKGLEGFWKRRFLVVLIPYVFVTVLKLPYVISVVNMPIEEILMNITLFSVSMDSSMWYVQYIVICYLVFYFIFSTKWKKSIKTAVLAGIAILVTLFYGTAFYRETINTSVPIAESYSHHLSFALGVIFCFFYDKAKGISVKIYAAVFIVSFCIVQFLVFPGIGGFATYYMNNLFYVVGLTSLWAIIKHRKKSSPLLAKLGDLSYYIYLNELVIMELVYRFLPVPLGVKAIVVVITSVLTAVVTKKIGDVIMKKK